METVISIPARGAQDDETHAVNSPSGSEAAWVELVRKNVEAIKFGSVQITVNDSQVTELAVAEKINFRMRKLERPKAGKKP